MEFLTPLEKNINNQPIKVKFMKKAFLILIVLATGLISYGQTPGPHPDNIDLGLFNNGANGSNPSSGAYVAVSLRVKSGGLTYTAAPAADQFVVYVMLPVTDFATDDVISIVQGNSALYGSASPTVMLPQAVSDIGDPQFYYAAIVLNVTSMNLSSLAAGTWSYAFTFKVQTSGAVDRTLAQHNRIRVVDQNNNAFLTSVVGSPTFSHLDVLTQNDLTAGSLLTLPASLVNLSGYKNGSKNTLNWKTASEQNNLGFEVQRSTDGTNYSAVGFVNSLANGGNSSTVLSYKFDDNDPAAGKRQYYRLKQSDFDGNNKLSNTVVITGDKPTTLSISGLFPNPARTNVKVMVDAPQADNVTVIVTDMNGNTVIQKTESLGLGSNTIPVDITKLATGRYLVKLKCQSSDCETTGATFNKQ
ncbi:MAG: T9SS type A sorting domain-containing protein [Bacteroidetes bacterium]|jgi:hypothetical protein|nr:MAG: T9SS type A sorting domain-containing protein [Bacteroidota bacterium]